MMTMTTVEWKIERARPGDGPQLAELVRQTYPREVQPYLIWASPKAGQYIEDLLRGAIPGAGARFYVARLRDEMVAVAYFRRVDGQCFVDSVYSTPAARKSQLTDALMYSSTVDYCREAGGCEGLYFDGNESKPVVLAWFRRLAAEPLGRRTWWLLPLPASVTRPEYAMPGVADAKEQAWGFTEIEITTARGRYRIGKLPGPYFRLMGAAGAEDNELLEALAGLDPQRSLLVVAGEGETIAGATRLAGWVRCRAPYEPFLKRLWGNIPSHYHEHLLADIA